MTDPAIQFRLRPGDALPGNAAFVVTAARELFSHFVQFDPVFRAGGYRTISIANVPVILDNNMLAPRIVVAGVAVGGPTSQRSVLPYKPAFAYLYTGQFLGASFLFNAAGTHLVDSSDDRAAASATQYFRSSRKQADIVLYPNTRLMYKGRGFAVTGVTGIPYVAISRGDPTPPEEITDETAAAVYVFSTDFARAYAYKKGIAGLDGIGLFSPTGTNKTLAMDAVFSTAEDVVPVAPVSDAPWVLMASNTDLYVYRYVQQDTDAPGSQVATQTIAAPGQVDLPAYTSGSAGSSSASATTSYSDSQDVVLCPSGQEMTLVSVPAGHLIPVSGTITGSVSASASLDFSTPPTVVSTSTVFTADAEYSGEASCTTSQSFSGVFCGIPITGSESLTWSRTLSGAAHTSSSRPSGVGNWTGSRDGSANDVFTFDYTRKSIHCVYGDATFGAAAIIEKTVTCAYDFEADMTDTGSGTSPNPGWQSWPTSWTGGIQTLLFWTGAQPHTTSSLGYLPISGTWLNLASNWPYPFTQDPGNYDPLGFPSMVITSTSSGSTHEVRELVLYHDGAEVHRETYYDHTTAGRPTFPYLPDPLQMVADPSRAENSASLINFYFRTLDRLDLRLIGDVAITDTVKAAANAFGICAELVWEEPGNPTAQHLFMDSNGADWSVAGSIPTGAASDNNLLFRV